jgi:hypothetical protein
MAGAQPGDTTHKVRARRHSPPEHCSSPGSAAAPPWQSAARRTQPRNASGTSSTVSTSGHAGETPLSGTTATKVKAAALAKYPGATIDRLETDSDGVYEAHVTTKAGEDVIVQVDKTFSVTGTQAGGGHGDHDGDGPAAR